MSTINTTGLGLEHGDIIEDNGTLFKVIRVGHKSTGTGTEMTRWAPLGSITAPIGSKAFWELAAKALQDEVAEAVETRIRGGQ